MDEIKKALKAIKIKKALRLDDISLPEKIKHFEENKHMNTANRAVQQYNLCE